jgi:hypothetical protein
MYGATVSLPHTPSSTQTIRLCGEVGREHISCMVHPNSGVMSHTENLDEHETKLENSNNKLQN